MARLASCIALALALLAHQLPAQQNMLARDFHIIENRGQLADPQGNPLGDIPFYASSGAVRLLFTPQGITQIFLKYAESMPAADEASGSFLPPPAEGIALPQQTPRRILAAMHAISMEFEGANPGPRLIPLSPNADHMNFYLAQCPEGITGVRNYQRLLYQDLYPNIDLAVYAYGEWMKYDFIVRPGGDPARIRIRYRGQERMEAAADGSLILYGPYGQLQEAPPLAFAGGCAVPCAYKLGRGGTVTLRTGRWSPQDTLLIDPVRYWSTYYGGAGADADQPAPAQLRADPAGNVVFSGTTGSSTHIASAAAHQTLFGGGSPGGGSLFGQWVNGDGFVAKFSPEGLRLWGTYYGGSSSDGIADIEIDPEGNIYAAGYTQSADSLAVASAGAHQTGLRYTNILQALDGMLFKLNSDGVRVWGTYYGGPGRDFFNQIELSPDGHSIYAAGVTGSSSGIADPSAHQPAKAAGSDAMLVRFDSGGQRVWGTYYGGEWPGDEGFAFLRVDASNNIYGAGPTASQSGIADSAYQNTSGGTMLVKFSSIGIRLWGRYAYAGLNLYACELDRQGNLFLGGGYANSINQASPGAHQERAGGGFLAKFSPDGARAWGTYYGGSSSEVSAIDTDTAGNIYICGFLMGDVPIGEDSLYATASAFQPQCQNDGDSYEGYLAKFSPDGSRVWGTYYGGEWDDVLDQIAVDDRGDLMIAGSTSSSVINLASPDAPQTAPGSPESGYDGILLKFSSSGTRIWATYHGGNREDYFARGPIGPAAAPLFHDTKLLALTPGNIYAAGYTESTSGLAAGGAHQPLYGGGRSDAMLVRYGPCGAESCPDLEPAGFAASPGRIVLPGSFNGTLTPVTLSGTVANSGGRFSIPSSYEVWLSADSFWNPASDRLLAARLLPSLQPQEALRDSFQIQVPDYDSLPSGAYYLLIVADPAANVEEHIESNNTAAVAVTLITSFGGCSLSFCPDLAVSNVQISPSSFSLPAAVDADFTVVNNSNAAEADPSLLTIWISRDPVPGADAVRLDSLPVPRIGRGGAYAVSDYTLDIPALLIGSGGFYLHFQADAAARVIEADEQNNMLSRQVAISSPCPAFTGRIDAPLYFRSDGSDQAVSIATDKPGRVDLWAKSISGKEWTLAASQISPQGSLYRFALNQEQVQRLGPEIGFMAYFEAAGPGGCVARSDTAVTYIEQQLSEEPGFPPPHPGGRTVLDYRIWAFPFEGAKPLSQQFTQPYDTAQIRIFHYDGQLHEFQYSGGFPDARLIGKGYWVISAERLVQTFSGTGRTPQASDADPYSIPLRQGWNQIGNPYRFALSWPDILQANPGLDTDQERLLYVFRGEGFAPSDRLFAYEGAFVYAGEAESLRIPVLKNESVNRTAEPGIPLLREPLESGSWDAGLSFESGGVRQDLYGFGMRPDALPGKDRYDLVSLPGFFGLPDLRFAYDSLSLSKDVVPQAKGHIWTFEAAADPASQAAVLRWDNSYWGSGGLRLYLFDTRLQLPADMAARDSYTFRPEGGPRKFRIYFGSEEFVRQHMTPERIVLGEPFPNPSSGTVEIPLAFPQGLAPSALVISDAAGRAVRRIPLDGLAPGFHTVRWDGTAASGAPLPAGLYFVVLYSGGRVYRGPTTLLSRS